jgi:hypothetical protein
MMITQISTKMMTTSRVAIRLAIIQCFATISVSNQVPTDELTDLLPAFRNYGTVAINATAQSHWISVYFDLFPAVINTIFCEQAEN